MKLLVRGGTGGYLITYPHFTPPPTLTLHSYLQVHLNMAACQLQIGDYHTAVYNCSEVGR